ncbi:hypothetical protein [Stieleria maiorica]|nr:hypothetical protein [Stieleria maiorica]
MSDHCGGGVRSSGWQNGVVVGYRIAAHGIKSERDVHAMLDTQGRLNDS